MKSRKKQTKKEKEDLLKARGRGREHTQAERMEEFIKKKKCVGAWETMKSDFLEKLSEKDVPNYAPSRELARNVRKKDTSIFSEYDNQQHPRLSFRGYSHFET